MVELIRTEDPVLLSWLEARLAAEGIAAVVFDVHTSSAFPGVLDAVFRRVMVDDAELHRARSILAEAPVPIGAA